MAIVSGIIVTHGNLGEELLRTAKSVYGDFSHCRAITNTSKSTQALADEITSVIEAENGTPCIVFVDFVGGSCGHACLQSTSARRGVRVISGVNLPMLLAFLNKRDEVAFEELPAVILERSHNSIKVMDPRNF